MSEAVFGNHTELIGHVPVNLLGELVTELHALIGMRVSINDCSGTRLAASSNNSDNPHCLENYNDPVKQEYCRTCTQLSGQRAGELGGPFLYRCYAGFAAVAIPVIVDGSTVALLMTSGFRIEPERMNSLERILEIKGEEYPEEVISESPFYHYHRITDIASILTLASKYISEAGLRNNIQSQLHEKSLELMTQMQMRSETEKLLSQAQFKALQSQVNPHFLFNTLNAISQMAILERADKTAEAIFALSSLLRRSLYSNSSFVYLLEEVDYINEYFKIKKMMYRERIRFVTDIEPSCLKLSVPVFTIQPLVENALLHGLEPKEDGGELRLAIRRLGMFISILIEDDGLGMEQRTLRALRGLSCNDNKPETSGIGVINVIQRLQGHFGDRFHWTINSSLGRGTSIELFLPEAREAVG